MKTIITPEKYGELSTALSRAQVHYKLMQEAIRQASDVVPNFGLAPFRAGVEQDAHIGRLLGYLGIIVAPEAEVDG